MKRRKIAQSRRRMPKSSILEARTITRGSVWRDFRKFLWWTFLVTCLLAVGTGLTWGIWWVGQKALYQNPDFRLKVIALNPNLVIDQAGISTAADIDLSANPSLFDIDVNEVAAKLRNQPAIADARAERHLPDTLAVTITPRIPKVWISCPAADLVATRCAGAMLADQSAVAYPCPELQLESAMSLPIIELPASAAHPITAGAKILQPELAHGFLLLDAARAADPQALQWIESVRQVNAWSMLLVTRQGTAATFGLSDHARQMENLRIALDHAAEKGYRIATINLIPKHNIPITLREEPTPPRAIPVNITDAPGGGQSGGGQSRRARDLDNLLKRN